MRKWFHRAALLLIVSFVPSSRAEEWPKWLGPEGTGISTETGLLEQWPSTGPARVWSARVGEGFSSAVAVNGKVYVLGMQGSNDVLSALDADGGKVAWSQSYRVRTQPD